MVSALSARLLNYNSTSSSSGAKGNSDFSSTSSSTGASNEDAAPERRPAVSGSKHDAEGDKHEGCFKRRKIDELTYAASRVKFDLEKGGLPFPSVHENKPRALEGYQIDMSKVQLISAKSVESPFLTAYTGKTATMDEYVALFSATRKSYTKRWTRDTADATWDERNSADSLTSSDSEASLILDLSPRLEDGLNLSSKQMAPTSLPPAKSIKMREALEVCTEPRLVTLSFSPFIVIHVNGAYTKLSGMTAGDVLGKPLKDIFKDQRCRSLAANATTLVHLEGQLTSVATKMQSKQSICRLELTNVECLDQSEGTADATVTHHMITLKPTISTPGNSSVAAVSVTARSAKHTSHCEVMG